MFYLVAGFIAFCFFILCMYLGVLINNKRLTRSCGHVENSSEIDSCACSSDEA